MKTAPHAVRSSPVPGVKMLITACALVLMIVGWAQLSLQPAPSASVKTTPASSAAPPPAWLLEPLELPQFSARVVPTPRPRTAQPAPITWTRTSR
jgi:hypothetical protein